MKVGEYILRRLLAWGTRRYDARMDHQPVVAVVGQSARAALGGGYQQEVDLPVLFKDVAREYVQTLMVPAQARHLVDRAVRIAPAELESYIPHRR